MKVIRRDAHDRSDTWFVLGDGSNLDEDLADLLMVLERHGLPALDRFHDPCSVLEILRAGNLHATDPSFPAGRELMETLEQECTKAPGFG